MTTQTDLAIVVPVLNEIEALPRLLQHLRHWQQRGAEVLLVDGGSHDQTPETARAQGFRVLDAARGRATQMNSGARACKADNLLFLHADTRLPDGRIKRYWLRWRAHRWSGVASMCKLKDVHACCR